MTTNKQRLLVEPYFGGFILESLTIGMYGEPRNAIREYIQNGLDSIQSAIRQNIVEPGKGVIEIRMETNSLTIRDNGAGLPADSAVGTLTSVGASNKDYRTNAGFRGIGRLAGIVFSDTVSFTTKAEGEDLQTTVVFDGKAMRKEFEPASGGGRSAEDVLRSCITVSNKSVSNVDEHFFEVKLESFADPPLECVSTEQLLDFVSQVAPVPYSKAFPFREQLKTAAAQHGIQIDEVKIGIAKGDKPLAFVAKQYKKKYLVGSESSELIDCEIYHSATKRWWAWVGKKDKSGAYDEESVRGIRVRVKNIQIDGLDIFRDIFQKHAKSHVRFQDWFVGEVFIDPKAIVPNARRDGFEETPSWKEIRKELGDVARALGKESYQISNKGQRSLPELEARLADARADLDSLRKSKFKNPDKIIELSREITVYLKRVARASKEADPATQADLQAIHAELADIKAECLKRLGGGGDVDVEEIEEKARRELVEELISLLEQKLSPKCMGDARRAITQYMGTNA